MKSQAKVKTPPDIFRHTVLRGLNTGFSPMRLRSPPAAPIFPSVAALQGPLPPTG